MPAGASPGQALTGDSRPGDNSAGEDRAGEGCPAHTLPADVLPADLLPADLLSADAVAGHGGRHAGLLARAKVNYALHVTGRRADGYHLLDSLVAFPEIGDRLTLALRDGSAGAPQPNLRPDLRLTLSGPFAASLAGDPSGEAAGDNLVLRAAAAFFASGDRPLAGGMASFHLDKRLPVASGIGGGSADAAAALRLLAAAFPGHPGVTRLAGIAAGLGADIPMCLESRPALVGGIGERIAPLARLPAHALVLVNPGEEVATPDVFRTLARRDNPPLPPLPADGFATFDALVGWLGATRNDLEPPALSLCPAIGAVLAALRGAPETRLARMSGSGATCFALTTDAAAATALAARLARHRPGWWVAAAPVAAVG